MAVGKLEYKKCTKCGREFPASTEYLHRDGAKSDGLHSQCKPCRRINYKKKKIEKDEQEKSVLKITKGITLQHINILKHKFAVGMGIEIRTKSQKLYGRVTGHYKHFMTVQTTNYPTSILYKDILIGAVKIK